MQNTGLQSEDLWIIGSYLEEHIIFPAGQHKVILWYRLTIINILSSMDDLETRLTLKFSLQKEQNCYSSLSTQVRSWIRSLFLHSIHACLLERKFNYVHISLFQAGIGKHFHVLFLFYLFLIVSFSICLIIGIRIQKQLSNVSRFLGSKIWTTRTDHHRWRLEPSKWKDEQGALSLK